MSRLRLTPAWQAEVNFGLGVRLRIADCQLRFATPKLALIFHGSPEEPVDCTGDQPRIESPSRVTVAHGVHSGPVSGVVDVNDQTSVAGAFVGFRWDRQTTEPERKRNADKQNAPRFSLREALLD